MKYYTTMLGKIIEDSWGFILITGLGILLKRKGSERSVFKIYNLQTLVENLSSDDGMQNLDGKNYLDFFPVFQTAYLMACLISCFFVSISVALLLIFPYYYVAISTICMPFLAYKFLENVPLNSYLKVILGLTSLVFVVCRLISIKRTFHSQNYSKIINFLDKIGKEGFQFFFILFVQYLLILVDTLLLKIGDFDYDTPGGSLLFLVYMALLNNIQILSLRSGLTNYFGAKMIPGYKTTGLLDIILNFLNARSCAVITLIAFFSNIFDFAIYRPFLNIPDSISTTYENNRAFPYYSTMNTTSALKSYFRSLKDAWHGMVRYKFSTVTFMYDLLPSCLFGGFVTLKVIHMFASSMLKPHEVAFIVFAHFMSVAQVFNSYMYIDIYKKYYGVKTPNELEVSDNFSDLRANQSQGNAD